MNTMQRLTIVMNSYAKSTDAAVDLLQHIKDHYGLNEYQRNVIQATLDYIESNTQEAIDKANRLKADE